MFSFRIAIAFTAIATSTLAFYYSNSNILSTRVFNNAQKWNFLGNADQTFYQQSVLRRAIDASKQCLKDSIQLIEIEFPANRKSDLSVTETLDTNRAFTRNFCASFSNLGKDLWVVFPDRKECSLARKSYGENLPFTLTSIDGVQVAPADERPKLMVAVNPGFNVEEWIELAKSTRGAPLIVINGNLDRLRNGYYPAIFYPGLARVTIEFYSKATQALFLSAIAVSGSRYAGWLTREYPGSWDLITLKKDSREYETLLSVEKEPNPKVTWDLVKQSYADKGFGWF